MININNDKFLKVKEEAKTYYQKIGRVYCPYLKGFVSFNYKGFNHLLSKSWNCGRSIVDQYTRLKLIPVAKEIISLSHTLQEFDSRTLNSRREVKSRWARRKEIVDYYVFIAVIKDKTARLKIVVKKIGNGEAFFYSLYPAWKVRRDINGVEKIFYSEDLENC